MSDLAARVWAAIDALAASLTETPPVLRDPASGALVRDPSLGNGDAGIALFYHYLHLARGDAGSAAQRDRFLALAVDGMAELSLPAELHLGFPGIGWALEHVGAGSEGIEAIDEAVADEVASLPDPPPLGHFDGLVGLGLYGLERRNRTVGLGIAGAVVERLARAAEREPGTGAVTWFTPPALIPESFGMRARFPRGHYSLSLAHGVPGVIGFLGLAATAGARRALALELLDGAVPWLLAQERRGAEDAAFPDIIEPEATPGPARFAWCFGEPGITAALVTAAAAARRGDWRAEAARLARVAAARHARPTPVMGVVDACLCHGSAGAAHLLSRLGRATDEPSAVAAGAAWLLRALEQRRQEPGVGVGGFLRHSPHDDPPWVDNYSMFLGGAGIGLILLASVTEVTPAWDRLLLLPDPGLEAQ